ncbi:hypothetical protein ACIREO_19505 [Streptomyces sp. NPDC102441]|uniref:hypothetical protein n=1 Tax=Streptomyces sp. NPDC102441 TaxID=3366176 RepID=UPI0037FCB3E0
MTSPRTRGTVAAVAVLTFGLVAGGCGAGGDGGGGGGGGEERALTAPSEPAATGTGPYATPSAARTDAPPLPEPTDAPEPKDTGAPPGNTIKPRDVDQADADAVSKGALTALWTFDTTTDSGPHDAELRAADAGWLTGAYADRLRARRPQPVSGAQWQEWAGHDARTDVAPEKTEDAARPPDSDTEAWRQWTVTATPSGSEGWAGEPVVVAVFVQLTRAAVDKPWRVADVTVR